MNSAEAVATTTVLEALVAPSAVFLATAGIYALHLSTRV